MYTITFDNGLELAYHEQIAAGVGADMYFAKETDFTTVMGADIEFVMNRLNDRPRASRGGKSPRELFLGQRVDLLSA